MAKAKPNEPTAVKEGEVRRFRCKRTCYWRGNLWTGEDEIRQRGGKGSVSTVEFKGPTTIPPNFQWDNWEEY